MTQQRRDNHSTEFGQWTRTQSQIDSHFGYTATNIDWCWENYNSDEWMLIEEKRYGYYPKPYQWRHYKRLDSCCSIDEFYKGFHLLVFENTSPEDGRILLDGFRIENTDLIEFLQFSKDKDWYTSFTSAGNVIKISDWDKTKKR